MISFYKPTRFAGEKDGFAQHEYTGEQCISFKDLSDGEREVMDKVFNLITESMLNKK